MFKIVGFVLKTALSLLALALVVAFGIYFWVQHASSPKIKSIENASNSDVAIVLGAGLQADNTPTLYLQRRLDAAKQLYDDGKVKAILLTGDNAASNHNEPQAMADYLAGKGMSRDVLVRDFAGFNTNDSCYRAKNIFGVNNAIVVTQDYHVARAAYLCSSMGMNIQGVGVSSADASQLWYYQLREFFATDNAWLDVRLGKTSEVGGEKEDTVQKILNGSMS
jgi:vancomycin permeability regulator SanA